MSDVTVSIPRRKLERVARVLQHLDGMQDGSSSTVCLRSTDTGLAIVIDTTSVVAGPRVEMSEVPPLEVALSPRFVRFVAAAAGETPSCRHLHRRRHDRGS